MNTEKDDQPVAPANCSAQRVNIVIRIEDTADPENAVEVRYEACDPHTILTDEKCKWVHGILRQHLDMFSPCPGGCSHTPAEHQMFDLGVRDGESGTHCPPVLAAEGGPLREAWLSGYSVGKLNAQNS